MKTVNRSAQATQTEKTDEADVSVVRLKDLGWMPIAKVRGGKHPSLPHTKAKTHARSIKPPVVGDARYESQLLWLQALNAQLTFHQSHACLTGDRITRVE